MSCVCVLYLLKRQKNKNNIPKHKRLEADNRIFKNEFLKSAVDKHYGAPIKLVCDFMWRATFKPFDCFH